MIIAARKTYAMEKENSIRNMISNVIENTERQLDMNEDLRRYVGKTRLTEDRITKILVHIPPEDIDKFYEEMREASITNKEEPLDIEGKVERVMIGWEHSYLPKRDEEDPSL